MGLPWSKVFNEVVSMDIVEIDGKKFLVMVDIYSRYCQAGWIEDKKPETIMQCVMNNWICLFGAPGSLLTDKRWRVSE